MSRPDLLSLLDQRRVVVFDGAAGSNLQLLDLSEDDFAGAEGCNEVLVRTRPDVVQALHESFLQVGCLVLETNTFGATSVVLAEYDLAHEAYELNRRAAALAREVALDHSTAQRPRYVAGSMGPTTKLPTLGHIGFDELVTSYRQQAAGLLDGGADLLVVETCQDVLQTKAALLALRQELRGRQRSVPLMVSLTMEAAGTMLLGTELAAALAALTPLAPDILGLNCATGPLEMKQHVRLLSRHSPFPISALPNAGMPDNVGGHTVYPLTPDELADWHASFIEEDGVQLVGGCCGTTPEHLERVVQRVEGLTPARREPVVEPALSSLYSALPLHQEPKPLLIGERANANGSRKFRKLLLADDVDGMVKLARGQERGGAHALDLCVAYVGRDELRDMTAVVERFTRQVQLPLVLDSTQPEVLEAALKRCAGRCLINSINLEDGEERCRTLLELARDYGAAVVALTIDEEGMARTVERKLEVAERILALATGEYGLQPHDLIFDMLTFTVASGDEGLRDAAVVTLDAIEQLKARHPGVWTVLGVSNISFGLKPRSRHVLNSLFLHMAVQRGLDLAIIEASKIRPLSRIEPEVKALGEALLLNQPGEGGESALMDYIRHFEDADSDDQRPSEEDDRSSLVERIQRKVVDGDRTGLALLLAAALTRRGPLQIINDVLIPAMKQVGDLFGAGQMQLPFVLQSAEVMKRAVGLLEPSMDREQQAASRGTLVLATVKGDVHDIGKNLVDILLSNNGYKVLNLGIKVPIEEMIRVYQEQQADAIGMSGLLVKSTLVMKENLDELRRRGLNPPVLLGGAALTRRYVEQDLRQVYGDRVHYGQDAFEGMRLMAEVLAQDAGTQQHRQETPPAAADVTPRNVQGTLDGKLERAKAFEAAPEGIEPAPVPDAPFLGTRMLELPIDEVLALINETTLFRGQWQYRRGKMDKEAYERLLDQEVRPARRKLEQQVLDQGLLSPRAIYGYLPCHSEGNQLSVLDASGQQELTRFHFPRQLKPPHHCIADFFRPRDAGQPDLLGMLVVTIGPAATERIAELFEEHRYRDYLHLHGLAVEAAEAAAEYLHRQMRRELGFAQQEPDTTEALYSQQYRGARYSFGYPACPDLEDQRRLLPLLEAERVGVSLTEGAQMVPEQSVSAIVVHHPAAKYFRV